MEYIIQARNLKKIYNQGEIQVTAVDIDELNMKRGKITSILGKSGSGKSTLLHLLGGMDTPTQGEILVDGINLYERRSKISHLGRPLDSYFRSFI